MVIATDSLLPTGPQSATDCWPRVSVAVALETSVTAAVAIAIAVAIAVATAVASAAADSIITAAADAAAVIAANATIAAPLAAAAGNNDDDAITTSKQASVISSTAKISLDESEATTSRMRGLRGAVGNESSSSCSYATINKIEMGRRHARHFIWRWWRNGSPGGIGSTIVEVAAMTTTMQ